MTWKFTLQWQGVGPLPVVPMSLSRGWLSLALLEREVFCGTNAHPLFFLPPPPSSITFPVARFRGARLLSLGEFRVGISFLNSTLTFAAQSP